MRILINCTTGLGNIILFLPTFRKIKQKLPHAEFTILLDSRWGKDEFIKLQFGQNCKFIYFPQKNEGQLKRILKLITLRKIKYDYVFRPYSGNSIKLAISILLFNSKNRIFYETNSILDRFFNILMPVVEEHYIYKNLRQLECLGYEFWDNNIEASLALGWLELNSDLYPNLVKGSLKNLVIGIHPGGNLEFSKSRMWPQSKYIQLINKLLFQNDNIKIKLFGSGEIENKIIDNIILETDELRVEKVANESLMHVCNLIKLSSIFIGNDSGLMNLSVGLGIPTLAILGPTNPKLTSPFGEQHKYVRLDLFCSPCFEKGLSDKCPHHNCLNQLEVDKVFNETVKMLERSKCTN